MILRYPGHKQAGVLFPLLLLIILTLLASLSGCSGQAAISKEELVKEMTAAFQDVETSQSELTIQVAVTGNEGDKPINEVTSYYGSTTLDIAGKKMQMNLSPSDPSAGETMCLETYAIDNTLYLKFQVPQQSEQWFKTGLPPGYWQNQNPFQQDLDLLKVSKVEIAGEEKVGEQNSYVVNVIPSKEKVADIVRQQTAAIQQMGGQITGVKPEQVSQDLVLKQWIAADTFLPLKKQLKITLKTDTDTQVSMDIVMKYNGYNQPVAITLPPEAKNAAQMRLTQ